MREMMALLALQISRLLSEPSHSNGHQTMSTQEPTAKCRLRLANAEDLQEVAGIAEAIVRTFNENAALEPDGGGLLHYFDAMVGQRHRGGAAAPPHVVIWLDLKADELDDEGLALALAARYMLDGRIPGAFDCTVDVYWRHTREFTPMLGGGPA